MIENRYIDDSSDIPDPTKIPSDSEWYLDYRCLSCGQCGTARFSGDKMRMDNTENIYPFHQVFCCQCKSPAIEYDEIRCYDPGTDEDDQDLQFDKELERLKNLEAGP